MKNKLKNYCWVIVVLFATITFSCNKFEELNTDTKNPAVGNGEAMFSTAQKNLSDIMVSTNVNRNVFRLFAQYWTETTYIDEANFDITTRSVPDNFYQYFYVNVLNNLKEAKSIISAASAVGDDALIEQKNKLAMINILNVYAYSIIFELYGDMPYTKALDIDNLLPKYDDAKTAYYDLIDKLNTAIANLAKGGAMGSADLVYRGDIAKWKKFANSLKLRMGIMLSTVDAAKAKTIISEAVSAGVFSSNDDNYAFKYQSSTPNTNPLWVDLIQSNRKDFVGANTLVNIMYDTAQRVIIDPRLPFYLDTIQSKVGKDTLYNSVYKGGIYGASSSASSFSNPGSKLKEKTFEALLLDYAEVQFYLAEAVERGFITGTASTYYNEGIKASITYWGGTGAAATTYLALPTVAYATATGNYKQKIGTQSWLAFYNRGYEGWTVWRRLGYPALSLPDKTKTPIPYRFTYPIAEQTRNGANYNAAAAAISGDFLTTKLWWNK